MNTNNIYANDFLDILFDGRNKDYGAYELRRSQDRRVRNAILGTASIALVIIGGYVLSNRLVAADIKVVHVAKTTVFDNIEPLPPVEKKVIPPPPPVQASTPPPASSSIKFETPKVVNDQDVFENEVPPLDSIGTKSISSINSVGDDINGIAPDLLTANGAGGTGNVVEGPSGKVRTEPFTFVEHMPTFPGGEAALSKFLSRNTRYPNMAVEAGIEGRIFVQFIVDTDGTISAVTTVGNHVGAGLEEEAKRVVKSMPKWNPGKQNGQAVRVQFNLPVAFKLQ